jgi:peptidoglycan hydrolase CwlO-like protein
MLKKLLTVTLLSVISLSSLAGSIASSKSTPQINAQGQKKYQQALVELKATNLQFLCGGSGDIPS